MPGIKFPQIPSFNIPLGALIPAKTDGLIVCEKGISVSNIANGTTRLQPVVLLTGQAAGVMAALCIANQTEPRKASVRAVQNELLKRKCYLLPFCDVDPADPAWEAVQKAGALGLMEGVGKSIDWENKTFFYPDSAIKVAAAEKNIQPYAGLKINANNEKNAWLTIRQAKNLIDRCANYPGSIFRRTNHEKFDAGFWEDELHLHNFNVARAITRKELAVLFIYCAEDFAGIKINFSGVHIK